MWPHLAEFIKHGHFGIDRTKKTVFASAADVERDDDEDKDRGYESDD